MTTSDPFASLPPSMLSAAGAARRQQLRAELVGVVRRHRRVRRATRGVAAALLVAGLAWLAWREPPGELPPPPRYTVVAEDPTVLARLAVPERPPAAEVLLDDAGLQQWLAKAGLPPGYVRTPVRIVLMPQVALALDGAP